MEKKFFKTRTAIFVSLTVFFLAMSSCSSSGGLSIPGESSVVLKNIVTEYMTIAKAYDDLKKYDKAVEYYQMAINADSENTLGNSAYYNIGHCYAMAGDWKNARTVYEELLKKDEDNTNLKISLAYIDAMSGNLESSCTRYAELCKKNPTDAALLKNYISVLIAAEKKDEAKNSLELLKKNFPDDSSIKEIEKLLEEAQNADSGAEEKK